MKQQRFCRFTLLVAAASVVATIVGCTSYPPPSEVLSSGWRCSADDNEGNQWFYSDPKRDVASKRAADICMASSAAPFSCTVDTNACKKI